jgi:hypothetical protein
MAAQNTIVKYFDNFKGLDLRVSDLKREQGAATATLNTSLRKTGALSKRRGYQNNMRTQGGSGLFSFKDFQDDGTNNITYEDQLLTFDSNGHKMLTEQFNITYGGTDTAYYDLYLNSADNNFYMDIYDDNVRVLNLNLGNGTESSFVTIAVMVSGINALTDFTCTSSSTYTTEPAAFVPIALNTTIPTTPGLDIDFTAYEQLSTPSAATNPLTNHYNHKDDTDFRMLSGNAINNNLYLAGENINLMKYDGLRVYKAGITSPSAAPSLSATLAGALTGDYKYKFTYEVYDANGNIIESDASPEYTSATLATNSLTLTFPTTGTSSGFNTDMGTVSSNATSATVTMTAPHYIKKYDTICVYNNATALVERHKVESITSTTAVLGSSIQTVIGDKVAASIGIRVYRTKAGGNLFYALTDLVNDSGAASMAFTDNITDANLGAIYVDPAESREIATSGCKYSCVWRGLQILAGDYANPNTVYYSDIESAEYFPALNSFNISTSSGKEITGIKALDNALYVFTEDAITVVSGDLSTGAFVVDTFSDEGIGCRAHNTLQEIAGEVWFLSSSGVYSVSEKGLIERSQKLSPEFKITSNFNFDQAVSFHWIDERKFLLMMPVTTDNGSGSQYTTTSSKIFVYDRFWDSWYEWSNFDFTGGITEHDDKIYLVDRNVDALNAVKRHTRKVHDTGLTYDFADHVAPIPFSYKSHWETLGEPSMFKKLRRIKVFSLDASLNDFESQSFTLTTALENDYAAVTISSLTLDFGGGAAGWGGSPWGNFPWGEVRLFALKHKLNQNKTKASRVVFSNESVNENVLVSGYELDIALPYKKEIKE